MSLRSISLAALVPSALACAVAVACDPPPPEVPEQPPAPTVTASASASAPPTPAARVNKVELASVGLDASAMDKSVDPCADFYQFACGGWLARAEIPKDRPITSRSFIAIADRNEEALHKILEDARQSPGDDPVKKKLGAFYGACMDEAAIEKEKQRGVDPLVRAVKKVANKKTLMAALTLLHKHKIWAFFDVSDEQDFKDATKVIGNLDQNGLGLPDRDHYTREDDKSKKLRETYVDHVEKMLALAGLSAKDAKSGAEDVMRIETALAKVSKSRVERRDPASMYNKIDREGVAKSAPAIDWDAYFEGIGFPGVRAINVTSVPFFEGLNKILDDERPKALKAYLLWHVVRSSASLLPKAFGDESFRMEAAITGQKEQRARWKRCVSATDAALGELLAQPFVAAHFSPASKEATTRYITEVSRAFADEVKALGWMEPATKEKALAKLASMAYLIGYPNTWRSYDFAVNERRWAESALASRAFDLAYKLGRIGKTVDRERWGMTPPTVNAYYRASLNHMVFPAGILQPPFFDVKSHVPVNLGAMGMVVGHELTHGFDDKGSQFDARGNLENWWTTDDKKRFGERTDCIKNQYAAYEVLPGVKIDGKLTLGENIADNAGVMLAFRAYRAMRSGAAEVLEAGGYNEDQQFFLSVGQVWCSKMTDDYARLRAQNDTHSHPRYRVNGSLSNFPAFAEAFACKPGAPMVRQSACAVW